MPSSLRERPASTPRRRRDGRELPSPRHVGESGAFGTVFRWRASRGRDPRRHSQVFNRGGPTACTAGGGDRCIPWVQRQRGELRRTWRRAGTRVLHRHGSGSNQRPAVSRRGLDPRSGTCAVRVLVIFLAAGCAQAPVRPAQPEPRRAEPVALPTPTSDEPPWPAIPNRHCYAFRERLPPPSTAEGRAIGSAAAALPYPEGVARQLVRRRVAARCGEGITGHVVVRIEGSRVQGAQASSSSTGLACCVAGASMGAKVPPSLATPERVIELYLSETE